MRLAVLNGPELVCAVSAGKLSLVARGGGVPATAIRRHGWARNEAGQGYYSELGASAVPAGSIRFKGIALTADGAIYTTNTAPGATAVLVDGMAIRADGALHVNTAAAAGVVKKGSSRNAGRVFI